MPTESSDTSSSSFDALITECIARVESDGKSALDRMCRQHPAYAAKLRRRIEMLLDTGLVDAASERNLPERLDDFRLIREIGSGGMGIVYLAEQAQPRRLVALKLVRPEMLHFGKARERFAREIESTRRLQHPGVIKIHAIGEDKGIPYFAMDYVDGMSLSAILHRVQGSRAAELTGSDFANALEIEEGAEVPELFHGSWVETCFRLIEKAALALHHAHEHGVLHRDLKPGNIMVTRSGEVVLLDFGLASVEGSATLTRSGAKLGSLEYMPPEQLRGETSAIDRRSDIYSLAVTLYELLALQSPYRAKSEDVVRARILDGSRTPVREANVMVARDGETICAKAMASDPGDRYQNAEDFARDIEHFLALQPIEAKRPGAWKRLRRWSRRRPYAALAIALGAVLVIGAPSVIAWMEHDKATRVAEEKAATERSLKLAFETLERLGNDFARRELRHVPGATELYIRLLEDTLETLREFRETHGEDPRVWRHTANAEAKLAAVLWPLGRTEEARAASDRAIALRKRLVERYPDSAKERFELLNQYSARIVPDVSEGEYSASKPKLIELRAEVERWLERFPGESLGESLLASVLNNLGVVFWNTKEHAKAVENSRRVVELYRNLVDTRGGNHERRLLGFAYLTLVARTQGSDPRGAELLTTKALEAFEKLVERQTKDPRARWGLARARQTQALLLKNRKAYREARKAHEAELELLRALVRDYPGRPTYRTDLAGALHNLGQIDVAERDYSSAISRFEAAIEQQEHAFARRPKHIVTRRFLRLHHGQLTRTLHVAGRHRELSAALPRMMRAYEQSGGNIGAAAWAAATRIAAQVPVVAKDAALSAARRKQLVDAYGRDAVAYLHRATEEEYAKLDFEHRLFKPIAKRSDFVQTQRAWLSARVQELSPDDPKRPRLLSDLGSSLHKLGRLEIEKKRYVRAAELLEEAIRVQSQALESGANASKAKRLIASHHYYFTRALYRDGKHTELHAALPRMIEAYADASLDVSNPAWVAAQRLAYQIPLLIKDDKLSEAERKRLVELYGSTSVAYLRRSIEAGFPRVNFGDRFLEPLVGRADFKELAAEVARKKGKK